IQLALSARHHLADRGRGRGAEARRSRLADPGAGQGQQERALRADADAGVMNPLPLWERVAPKAPGEGLVPREPHHRPIARHLRNFARSMRREPTDGEAAMWRLLRDRRLSAFKFRRQAPFKNYILDFVCFEKRLVIEIEGSQHSDSQSDLSRAAALASEGFE